MTSTKDEAISQSTASVAGPGETEPLSALTQSTAPIGSGSLSQALMDDYGGATPFTAGIEGPPVQRRKGGRPPKAPEDKAVSGTTWRCRLEGQQEGSRDAFKASISGCAFVKKLAWREASDGCAVEAFLGLSKAQSNLQLGKLDNLPSGVKWELLTETRHEEMWASIKADTTFTVVLPKEDAADGSVPRGLQHGMRVQRSWRQEHAPSLSNFEEGPLVRSPGGQHATRTIAADVPTPGGEHAKRRDGKVEYDVPDAASNAKQLAAARDAQREREERAILQLDPDAAARERKEAAEAERSREERECKRQEAEVKERERLFVKGFEDAGIRDPMRFLPSARWLGLINLPDAWEQDSRFALQKDWERGQPMSHGDWMNQLGLMFEAFALFQEEHPEGRLRLPGYPVKLWRVPLEHACQHWFGYAQSHAPRPSCTCPPVGSQQGAQPCWVCQQLLQDDYAAPRWFPCDEDGSVRVDLGVGSGQRWLHRGAGGYKSLHTGSAVPSGAATQDNWSVTNEHWFRVLRPPGGWDERFGFGRAAIVTGISPSLLSSAPALYYKWSTAVPGDSSPLFNHITDDAMAADAARLGRSTTELRAMFEPTGCLADWTFDHLYVTCAKKSVLVNCDSERFPPKLSVEEAYRLYDSFCSIAESIHAAVEPAAELTIDQGLVEMDLADGGVLV